MDIYPANYAQWSQWVWLGTEGKAFKLRQYPGFRFYVKSAERNLYGGFHVELSVLHVEEMGK